MLILTRPSSFHLRAGVPPPTSVPISEFHPAAQRHVVELFLRGAGIFTTYKIASIYAPFINSNSIIMNSFVSFRGRLQREHLFVFFLLLDALSCPKEGDRQPLPPAGAVGGVPFRRVHRGAHHQRPGPVRRPQCHLLDLPWCAGRDGLCIHKSAPG